MAKKTSKKSTKKSSKKSTKKVAGKTTKKAPKKSASKTTKKPAKKTPKAKTPKGKTKGGKSGKKARQVKLTQEMIAQRSYEIWQGSGCIPGRDHLNWQEAERQLRAELGLD